VTPVRTSRKVVEHEDVILFSVGGTTFAIRAGAVDEIRNLDGLSPLSRKLCRKPKEGHPHAHPREEGSR
jgi:hypothetical protein